jgi:uncharacterized protein YceK
VTRWLALWVVVLGGCGSVIDPPAPDAGRACTVDADCVPNGCCGEGTSAIHVLDGPDCSMVRCNGMCPVTQIRCGCGLPVCRDSRCVVAVSVDPQCG